MRKTTAILLLHDGKKSRWYLALLCAVLIGWYGWQCSPWFMVYVVGVPKSSELTWIEGNLRVEGALGITRDGRLTPPAYYLDTKSGPVRFYCGFKPQREDCFYFDLNPQWTDYFKIGHDDYFGVVQVIYPKHLNHLRDRTESAERLYFKGGALRRIGWQPPITLLLIISTYAFLLRQTWRQLNTSHYRARKGH